MHDHVVVRLRGGLGNQMFQYAAARALADRLGVVLLVDTRAFKLEGRHGGYMLDRFSVRARIANDRELRGWPNWVLELAIRLRAVRSMLPRAYFEQSFSFDAELSRQQPGSLLIGYWQSERYFSDAAERIRADFALSGPLPTAAQRLRELQEKNDFVALHVRRGDYVSLPSAAKTHGLCSLKYYRQAIEYMQAMKPDCRFMVFSDDLNWARRELPLDSATTLYAEGNSSNPEIDLTLMGYCRHHIIANSSFSWWGAWLAKRPDQLVVAPTPWFADDKLDASDLTMTNWHYIDRQ